MTVDFFGGIPVSDYRRALPCYERLLGSEPAFLPNATEAVWEIAEHRYLYIAEFPGVRKVVYRDLDGNEVSFGGSPARATNAS